VRDGAESLIEETAAIAGAVVGDNPLDGDAVDSEEGLCSIPEGCGGGGLLVGEDLGVGESAVAVDG
jgi:hypothetical protein